MNWKKFKKDNVFLNYTIMLLPHSQKKPIHFKLPVWVFGAAFFLLITLVGCVLFSAGSSYQLRRVSQEKEALQLEWEQISRQKEQIELENADLKVAREEQEEELKELERKTNNTVKELEQKTKDTMAELEKLTARENEIRSKLGLEPQSTQPEEPESFDADNSEDVEIVKKNLVLLNSTMEEQAVIYDDLLKRIPQYRKEERRKAIVNYALQFVGNRYVYGGNDPNTGVDCSGFSRYVMSHAAGIGLSRTANSQSAQGRRVSEADARPGDLVFYGSSDHINHVAIYIGNGKVVHASNERVGITVSGWKYREPVKIVNVLGD